MVFLMSFKESITAPVLLKMPPIPPEHPTAPQPPVLLESAKEAGRRFAEVFAGVIGSGR